MGLGEPFTAVSVFGSRSANVSITVPSAELNSAVVWRRTHLPPAPYVSASVPHARRGGPKACGSSNASYVSSLKPACVAVRAPADLHAAVSTATRTVAPPLSVSSIASYGATAATAPAVVLGTNCTLPSFSEHVKVSAYMAGPLLGSGAGTSVAREVTAPFGYTVVRTKSYT